MRWRSSTSVPRAVADALPLVGSERVLAGATDTAGRWHVGTDAALFVAVDSGHERRPWESLEGATWDRESGRLTVVEVADFGEVQPRYVLELVEPGRFLELVRERITASVLVSWPVQVAGRGKAAVTAVARRSPTRTGEVTFSFVLDRGLDPRDPAVEEAARSGLRHVREQIGA